jgi:hypothetical protein
MSASAARTPLALHAAGLSSSAPARLRRREAWARQHACEYENRVMRTQMLKDARLM